MFNKKSEDQEIESQNNYKSVLDFFLELVKVVIISLAIIIPIRAYVAQPFYVEGASMEPSFYDSEYLIIDEISYHFSNPERGDVVIVRPPNNLSSYYIKRIIGLPNETVEVRDNKIYIYNDENPSGFLLDESKYLSRETFSRHENKTYETLGENEYFVMGDNRENSLDSRRFGPITFDEIKGQVFLRAFPFNRFTLFANNNYYN